jgi:hypothetical protein
MTLALVAWSIVRLRPASRSLYDVKTDRGRAGRIKAALRRADRRRPCGDDPVYWQEIHAVTGEGAARRVVGRVLGLALLGALGLMTWWLAGPAFRELMARGYGPSPETSSTDPLRVFEEILGRISSTPITPGRARLQFNAALRLATAIAIGNLMVLLSGWSFGDIHTERKRDTWLALITTPLTAREILRGKALAALWKARWCGLTLVVFWAVGVASGSVHPLGLLASLAILAAMGAYGVVGGLSTILSICQNENLGKPPEPPSPLKMLMGTLLVLVLALPLLAIGTIIVGLFIGVPLALCWIAPLSFEDVAAIFRGGPFPEFGDWPIPGWIGARAILLCWVVGTVAIALRARQVGRSNERRFDEAVGRPTRPRPGPEADRIERLRTGTPPG